MVPRILKSKAAAERPRSSAAEHRRLQPAQVLESVAAQSEDSLATASLECRLRVLVRVNREAQKNADNPESIDLRPHRLPVEAQAKREVEQGKAPMGNLVANQEPERLLQLSTGKGSRSAERKRARGPHRHEDHNNRALLDCSRLAASGRLGTRRRSAVATAVLQFAPRSRLRP